MERCGISGDVRVVRGVPIRLTQNREDTSWAEEYSVEAAPPLSQVGMMPRKFAGPWQPVGRLVGEGASRWRVMYLPSLGAGELADGLHSFNDALGELAGLWKERIAGESLRAVGGAD
jgi:hypothetical protein